MTFRVRLPGRFRPRTAYRVAAAAAAIVTISALAACGSSNGSTAESAAAAATTKGASGTLNWEWELPTSWDPVTSSAGWDMHALGLVYASITTLDPKGTVEPGLASSWKYAADGKSVTFTLRPGLKFSDGSPLTATSVKQNIDRGQTQGNSTVASELSVISTVVVNSPTSFTLDLTQVDYQVPDLLAGKDGMIVNPAAFTKVGSLATQPEGAGPFTLRGTCPTRTRAWCATPTTGTPARSTSRTSTCSYHPARADPLGPRVGGGERRLHRGQPGRGGQGGRVQDRRDPVRGGRRARHPDDDRAVQQPGRGAGDQLRDRPAGHLAGPGIGVRVGRLPAVPGGFRRLQLEARQRVPLQPRPGQAAARQGRVLEGAEDHPDRAPASTTRSPSRSRASSRRSASTPRSGTSPGTPRPSTCTWTRPSRLRSTGRRDGCPRWRCSTSSTASRA